MPVEKWEYLVKRMPPTLGKTNENKPNKFLTELGTEGWELVAVYSSSAAHVICILKRRLPPSSHVGA